MTATKTLNLVDLARSLDAAGQGDRALTVLDRAVSRDDEADAALALKADMLRSRGALRLAAETFQVVAERNARHPFARYLSDLLSGRPSPLPDARPAPWPSPFVRLEHFLDGARHDELLALVSQQASAFEPSTVGVAVGNGREPRVVPDARTSYRLAAIEPVAEWMRPLVAARIPMVFAQLGVAPFEPAEIEIKCTAYGDGNFFLAHSDNLGHPTRRISYVYYFHSLPKRYTGGALILYDGNVADPSRFYPDRFTRLDTVDDSIVFFPSGIVHEVDRVVSPSGRFEDARFTLAGHVHAAATTQQE